MSFSWENKRVLITGGTGSFGQAFVKKALSDLPIKTLCILSRDELKQAEMRALYPNEPRLRFFVGDIRDRERVISAMNKVDIVIHAAAMKRIEACEYNPMEAVKTNILGTQNVVSAAAEMGVDRVLAISTDKAVKPITHYGATKMCMEQLVVLANGKNATRFSCVRYGNVAGSRGSVISLLKDQASKGIFTITHPEMTRFWITLPEAVDLVLISVEHMEGGEIITPKLPSFKVTDLAKAFNPEIRFEEIGMRGMEKLHEEMLVNPDNTVYDSGSNQDFLSVEQLREKLNEMGVLS
jgi:UDP-N-acetylglucosamine 4,6-dehydratase